MNMHIDSILLWPKDSSKKPRRIDFKPGVINVITGASKRGKSALLMIIDYCLASKKCSVPVGLIREKTSWFGIKVTIGTTTMILARREPGQDAQSGDMIMLEGPAVEFPATPVKNCHAEEVKDRLNQAAGLSNLKTSYTTDGKSYEGKLGFRDLVAFCFQPQHIIANPHTLFFRTDTNEYRERLKQIFPVALGVRNNETLWFLRQLADLEKEFEKKKRQLENIKAASDVWLSEVRAHYTTARELGLLKNAVDSSQDWSPLQYISQLATVPVLVRERDWFKDLQGNSQVAVSALIDLEKRENELAHQIASLRQQLLEMRSFNSALFDYNKALVVQKDRVAGVGWFSEVIAAQHQCPVCKSDSDSARKAVSKLLDVSRNLTATSKNVADNQEAFQKEIADTEQALREQEGNMRELRKERSLLETRSSAFEQSRQTLQGIMTFVGRLEQALANYRAGEKDDGLIREARELETKIQELRKKLDPRGEATKMEATSKRITSFIQGFAGLLDIEKPQNPVHLDTKNLTLKITSETGREDLLWEIGSGANWVGYHIATMLALQQLFSESATSPVPGFLVVDQPSQAYFPAGWPDDKGTTQPKASDQSDIRGVHKIFETLSAGIKKTKNKLQVIVVDHADEITWDGIPDINLVGRWREADGLIQSDWIAGPAS